MSGVAETFAPDASDHSVRAAHRVDVLSEVIGAFADATTDYARLLETIARTLSERIGDLCSVLLLTPEGDGLTLAAMHDVAPEVLADARASFAREPLAIVPIQRHVLDTGEAYLSQRMRAAEIRRITTESRAAFAERIGMHSVLLVALRARGRPIGMINLLRHRADRQGYDDADRDLVQRLADHAAVAIVNARVLQRHHDELRLARDQAEAACRELEAFSDSVAHDLRAPLRAIEQFSAILHADHADRLDDEGRDYLRRVCTGAEHMSQLLRELRGLSLITRAEMEREDVDLGELAGRILHGLATRDPERRVEARISEGLSAHADRGLARVLLEQLIGNAWKFTSKRAAACIEVAAEAQGDEAVFVVRDDGAGFDMAHASRLFLPFHRLHSTTDFEGSGIGLATAQRIIARHGGRIWAEATPGHGATFRFTLGRR